MSNNREPLNPYEPPQTVASGQSVKNEIEEGESAKASRYQLIGFVALWIIALLGLVFGVLSGNLGGQISVSYPDWHWLGIILLGIGFVFVSVGAISLVVFTIWFLISVVKFAIVRGSGYFVRSSDDAK